MSRRQEAMTESRRRGYSGALNEPIVRWQFRSLTAEPNELRISREWWAKVPLLFAHYELRVEDDDRWRQLAFVLAREHVPGMQVVDRPRPRKGPSRKWELPRARQFVETIDQIAGDRGKGISDAIRVAKKRKKLEGSVAGLETRYYEAKRRLLQNRKQIALAEAWLGNAAQQN